MRPRDVRVFLMDAATAAQRVVDIRERTSVDQLKNDLIVRAAIERHLITIGEALQRARALLPDAEIGVSHIDAIIGLRNRLVHGYFAIEWTRIVAILDADLDRLFEELQAALAARHPGDEDDSPEATGVE